MNNRFLNGGSMSRKKGSTPILRLRTAFQIVTGTDEQALLEIAIESTGNKPILVTSRRDIHRVTAAFADSKQGLKELEAFLSQEVGWHLSMGHILAVAA
jgi:hypothetical protein